VVASERDRPDIARRRAQWIKYQCHIAPERLVFIDETWTKTNMAPLRGWAPRGRRLTAKVPHGHWKTTTFLAALRHDRIDAPWLLDGPIDGESFQTYVERVRPRRRLLCGRPESCARPTCSGRQPSQGSDRQERHQEKRPRGDRTPSSPMENYNKAQKIQSSVQQKMDDTQEGAAKNIK
jgi:hypothetical protein